jgi:hypothetical protein
MHRSSLDIYKLMFDNRTSFNIEVRQAYKKWEEFDYPLRDFKMNIDVIPRFTRLSTGHYLTSVLGNMTQIHTYNRLMNRNGLKFFDILNLVGDDVLSVVGEITPGIDNCMKIKEQVELLGDS